MFFFILIWLAAINIAAYFLIKEDKKRAIQSEWRIPEKTFFLLSILGGFMGVHLAMEQFRHKTKHLSFRFIVILSAFIWVLVFPCLFIYLRFYMK